MARAPRPRWSPSAPAPTPTSAPSRSTCDDADPGRVHPGHRGRHGPVRLRVAGEHQVSNALAAAAIGLAVGLDLRAVAAALSAAAAASRSGGWQLTDLPDGVTVINDAYNANPDSMRAALRALATIGAAGRRRTWAVLGPMAELGPTTRGRARRGRPAGACGWASTRSGRRRCRAELSDAARLLHLGAHLEGSWGGESVLGRRRGARPAAGRGCAGRRGAGQGVPGGRAGAGGARPDRREVTDERASASDRRTGSEPTRARRRVSERTMKLILIAAVVGLAVAILLTPYLIKVFSRPGFGQEIREDGPQTHQKKRGTPTMGGAAIIIAMWAGYLVAVGTQLVTGGGGPTASGLAAAVPDHRTGPGRLPRRLHQDPQAAQPGAEQEDEVHRPDVHRGVVRRSAPCCSATTPG